jgi:tRNA U38,U39,U40 pseudouridine synthase TruA
MKSSSAAAAPPLHNQPKTPRHPLWTTLAVDHDKAQAILDHLLHQGLLAPDVVRSAYAAVCAQEETDAKASPAKVDAKVDATASPAQEATAKARPAALEVPPAVVAVAPLSSRIRTRHIALEVFYDGEHYTGLAENVGQAKDNSVERALFQALVQCQLIESRETAHYSRCGRTDKGVSAAGQVVALQLKSAFGPTVAWDAAGQDLLQEDDLPNSSLVAQRVWVTPRKAAGLRTQKNLKEMAYDQMLNNLLPPTIRVLGWTPVSADFSARFSATGRIYRYVFRPRQMNVDKMRQGLAGMVGTHDFRNLCKLVRTYTCLCIKNLNPSVCLTLTQLTPSLLRRTWKKSPTFVAKSTGRRLFLWGSLTKTCTGSRYADKPFCGIRFGVSSVSCL